jgi:hypothetical protein
MDLPPPLRNFSDFHSHPQKTSFRDDGTISLNETSGFAGGSQVIEIIGRAKWGISPNRLFSMG